MTKEKNRYELKIGRRADWVIGGCIARVSTSPHDDLVLSDRRL
jgi:hypothetical protein